jgi:hypothetical protein
MAKASQLDRMFSGIERIGSRIPDPFMLFIDDTEHSKSSGYQMVLRSALSCIR